MKNSITIQHFAAYNVILTTANTTTYDQLFEHMTASRADVIRLFGPGAIYGNTSEIPPAFWMAIKDLEDAGLLIRHGRNISDPEDSWSIDTDNQLDRMSAPFDASNREEHLWHIRELYDFVFHDMLDIS